MKKMDFKIELKEKIRHTIIKILHDKEAIRDELETYKNLAA